MKTQKKHIFWLSFGLTLDIWKNLLCKFGSTHYTWACTSVLRSGRLQAWSLTCEVVLLPGTGESRMEDLYLSLCALDDRPCNMMTHVRDEVTFCMFLTRSHFLWGHFYKLHRLGEMKQIYWKWNNIWKIWRKKQIGNICFDTNVAGQYDIYCLWVKIDLCIIQ